MSDSIDHRKRPGVPPAGLISRRRFGGLVAAGAGVAVFAPPVIGRAAPASLKIGHIQPLTGPSAAYGIRTRDGAILAMEDLNAKGVQVGSTTYKIELNDGDMANDPRQAITLFRQSASDPSVLAAMGPTNSVGFVPLVPVAGQLKMVLVGNGSGAPIKEWNPYGFRVNPVSKVAIPVLLAKVVQLEKIKKLAVIYDQTQDAQLGDAEVCKAEAGKLGYEVVAYEAFRSGDQDFSPQIAKIRSVKPDAIYVAGATGDGVKVASQIREAGIDKPMITGFGSFQDPVYWDGTKGQVKGCYTWLAQDLSSPSAELKTFLDRYNKRFPQSATSFSTYGYDSVLVLVEAAKKAGSLDRAKVQEALAHLEVHSPIGTHITFKNPPDGENQTPSVVTIQVTGRGTYKAV